MTFQARNDMLPLHWTRHNFQDHVDDVVALILDASFIALDLEFTGLCSDEKYQPHYYDSYHHRYQKVQNGAKDFLCWQVGLAIFIKEGDGYACHCGNFNIFPGSSRMLPTKKTTFTTQVSTIHFLSQCHFDFNRCFRDGIPYLSEDTEEKASDFLNQCQKGANVSSLRLTYDSVLSRRSVERYLAEWQEKRKTLSKTKLANGVTFNIPDRYLRIMFAQEVTKDRQCSVQYGKDDAITVFVVHGEQIKDRQHGLALYYLFIMEKAELVGFRMVLDAIIASKKPIVGHNLYTDLCFLMQQFYDLGPETPFAEFVQKVHREFPIIYDTKHIASVDPTYADMFGSHTSLGDVFAKIKDTVKDDITLVGEAAVYGLSEEDIAVKDHLHEGAYDAYATGSILVAWSKLRDAKLTKRNEMMNKIHLMRSDLGSIDFEEETFTEPRSHVIVISDYRPDLYSMLCKYRDMRNVRDSDEEHLASYDRFRGAKTVKKEANHPLLSRLRIRQLQFVEDPVMGPAAIVSLNKSFHGSADDVIKLTKDVYEDTADIKVGAKVQTWHHWHFTRRQFELSKEREGLEKFHDWQIAEFQE